MDLLATYPLLTGFSGLGLTLVLILVGVPIAWSIFAVGFFGQVLFFDFTRASAQLFSAVFETGTNLMLASIPLFVFMGQLVAKSRIGYDLYDCVYKWTGRVPGGIAIAGVVSGAGFGAVTGVSAAAVATMSTIALPQMERYKYDMKLAAGSIASSSALAILIPPSLLMIIYGIATETSIGALFIAGIFPAILLMLSYAVYIVFISVRSPNRAPRGERFTWKERLVSLAALVPVFALFTLIIGGIYLGLFTPSEAAGVGAFGMMLYLAAKRQLTLKTLSEATTESLRLTVMIFLIFIPVTLLTSFLVLSGVIDTLVNSVNAFNLSPLAVMAALIVLYILLGMVLDGIGMLLLTLPVTFPIVMGLGYDPIWWGIIVTILVEIGLITPPVGLNCYILKQSYPSITLGQVFHGVIPFVFITIGWIAIFLAWPQIILWVVR